MGGRRGHRIGAALLALLPLLFASPAAAAWDPAGAAGEITRYFSTVQRADGNVADPVRGAGSAPRYSQAMLGASALASGDVRLRSFALRALDYVAAHPESNVELPSVFEIGAAAAAFNALAATPEEPVRGRLAAWLAGAPAVWVQDDGAYRGNKSLVEAHALLELCRAGVAVRPDAPALCARAGALLERGLPAVAREYTTRDARGRRVTVLSDPPGNPIAYHQLSTAYLARATTLRPPSRRTRRLLVQMARGVVALAAPDGDVAYWGRSQEQGWSLVLGAYGLREAARYTSSREAAELGGAAARLLERFRAQHAGGPYGTHITPSYVGDPFTRPGGLDDYASVSTYAGLTSFALSWLAEQPRFVAAERPRFVAVERPRFVAAERPRFAAARAPRARGFVMPHGTGSFAVVRTGSTWFAVRRRRDVADLRSDFGLAAAKTRGADGGWRNVTPVKPMTLTGPDSAGPILRAGGAVGYPDGRAIAVRRGVVVVRGGWRTASGRWLREATFRFAPLARGVRVSVRVRRGDRLEYSAFAVSPRVAGRVVTDGARSTRVSLPASARFEPGYASGEHRALTRVRLSMQARRGGVLVVRHTAR